MKNFVSVIALVSVMIVRTPAQDRYLWLRLTGNRVVTNSVYRAIEGDTLVIVLGGRICHLPVAEIVQVRVANGATISAGVLVGGGIGLASGALLTYSLQSMVKPGAGGAATVLAFGLVGAIIGGAASSLEKPGDLVDLEGLSKELASKRLRDAVRGVTSEAIDKN